MRPLISEDFPISLYPKIATAIGLNEAIVLQQVHYWTEKSREAGLNKKEGYFWVYNSYEQWAKQFPWWSIDTIKRTFRSLEKLGVLVTGKFNLARFDKTKWYRVNYEKLAAILVDANCTETECKINQPIPETTTETINGYSPKRRITQNSSSNSFQNFSNKEIKNFIIWYYNYYESTFSEPHPRIRADKQAKVQESLEMFCGEHDLSLDDLKKMTDAFFKVEGSDHHISHFATEGILTNRYYECVKNCGF